MTVLPTRVLHFIDGSYAESRSGRTFETINPATGKVLATVAFGEQEDVDRAVDAAWRAFVSGAWRFAAPASRAACLRRLASLLRDRADELALMDSVDGGKPIADARKSVAGAAALLDYASTLPENVRGQVFARETGYFSYSQREPYGVVGAIAPWNFPLSQAVMKTAFALAVGNSVVLKMAEQTPLSATLYVQIAAEAGVPAGVLNLVHGDGGVTGAALAKHPRVRKLTFTGSTEVGRSILNAAASSLKSCHLELGGKTPNIVLDDAQLEQAIAGSLFTSFWNAGQVCTAGSRLLVHSSIADEFVAELAARARRLRIGDPLLESTQLGPVVTLSQLERVHSYVDGAVKEGAYLVAGGRSPSLPSPHDAGYYIEPTVFGDVTPRMTIAREEIFGPVISVMQFDSDEEAIALANDVAFGLAATVWTSSLTRAFRFAERLEAGVIWTNWPHAGGPHIPYEGHKDSGLGEDLGLEAIMTFTRLKVNHINASESAIAW
jgi:acyl-CoA reductase-like NAD-dependent aldehyde dehydrogenase